RAPARAPRQDVVLHHVLRTRHDGCGDITRRRGFGDPAAFTTDVVVDRPSQANVAQYVGQDVVAHEKTIDLVSWTCTSPRKGRGAIADSQSNRGDSGNGGRRTLARILHAPTIAITHFHFGESS